MAHARGPADPPGEARATSHGARAGEGTPDAGPPAPYEPAGRGAGPAHGVEGAVNNDTLVYVSIWLGVAVVLVVVDRRWWWRSQLM